MVCKHDHEPFSLKFGHINQKCLPILVEHHFLDSKNHHGPILDQIWTYYPKMNSNYGFVDLFFDYCMGTLELPRENISLTRGSSLVVAVKRGRPPVSQE